MSGEPPKLGNRSSRALSDMSRRIQEIVDAAERAALEIQDEAEEEARKIIESARSEAERIAGDRESALGEISEAVKGGAERLAEQARSLAADIESATARLGEGKKAVAPASPLHAEAAAPASGGEPEAPPAGGSGGPFPTPVAYPGTRAVETPEGAEPEAGNAKPTDAVGEEPLLRATQMAVAGASRADIEEALRTEFGVSDPGAVADEILGAEAS